MSWIDNGFDHVQPKNDCVHTHVVVGVIRSGKCTAIAYYEDE